MSKQKNHSSYKDKLHAGKQQHTKETIGENRSIRNTKMGEKSERQKVKYKIGMMAIFLAGACILVYYFHVVLEICTVSTHFFYIPIILAAIWWKRKGLVVAVILSALLVSSHIFFRPEIDTANVYLRVFMFIVIAVVVVTLSERIAKNEEFLRVKITERVKAEEQIRQQNEFLNTVLESLTHPFYVLDANDYTVKMANSALYPEKLSEKTACYTLTHKRDKPCNGSDDPCPLEEIKKTKRPVVTEHVHYDKDGNIRNVEVHAYPILDDEGNVSEIIEYSLDITERKQAEKALRESENKYRTLLENLPQRIFSKDRNLIYVSCNENFARELGIRMEEFKGKTDYDFFPKELAEKYRADDKRIMEAGTTEYIEEKYIRNGQEMIVQTVKTPIKDEQDNIVGVLGIFWDITELKHAQEAIERLSKFPSENPNPVLRVQKDGKILYSNDAAVPLLAKWKTKVGGAIPLKWRRLIDKAFEFEKAGSDEEEVDNKIFSFVVAPILDGGYANLYARDVTERKKAEEALRESERRFKQVAECAGEWIWEVNADGLYTYASPVVEKMLGYKPKEIVGKKYFYSYFAPDVKDELKRDAFSAFSKKRSFRGFVNLNIHKNGSIVILETSGTPVLDYAGNLVGYRGLDTDITERKRAEEELKDSEEKFRLLFECAPDGYYLSDLKGNFIDGNRMAEQIIGYKRDELIGKSFLKLKLLPPVQIPKAAADVAKNALGKHIGPTEYTLNRRDGTQVWVEIRAYPVKIKGKTVVLGIARNITERKKTEAELKATQEKLIETARTVGMAEVAADVLHNVGNVLNSINVSTTVIREKVTNSELANLEKVASIINEHTDDLGTFLTEDPQGKHIPVYLTEVSKCLQNEQADIISRLRALVDNVHHIKDIIGMQQSYAKVSGVEVQTSLSKLVEDAIQINSAGLERHGTQLIREFEELGDVEIDKQKLLQILVNLVSNAKYALSGSKREEKLLTIRIYKHCDDRFRLEVADNGVGISEDNLTKIFSHGFTTKKHGHGFGLHSSALSAKEMGGTLTVYSDGLGQGATFTLELPFKPVEVMK